MIIANNGFYVNFKFYGIWHKLTSNLLTYVIFTFHTHRNTLDSPQDNPNSRPAFVLVIPKFFFSSKQLNRKKCLILNHTVKLYSIKS